MLLEDNLKNLETKICNLKLIKADFYAILINTKAQPSYFQGTWPTQQSRIYWHNFKKCQIPLRTPQRPQPVFDPNRVCVHFTFCCHECTHFAWISLLYHLTLPAQTRGAHTVLGTVVLLYIYTVVQSLFTLYNCTLASTSLASVLSTNHRRASIYLPRSDWSIRHRLILAILIATCWHSRLLPCRAGCVKIEIK